MALRDHLEDAFGRAEPEHFRWQTACPYVADRERELVRAAFTPLGARVLDIGCGEGATLVHLDAPDGAVGVDLFEDKIAFARAEVPTCTFVTGEATELPFEDDAFDHVLVRDVIHHLDEPHALIDEAARVLAPGGRIDVLEPCRYNPLIALHAIVTPAERGELRSTEPFLRRILAARFDVQSVTRHQALPIHRVLFHPHLGSPRLAERSVARTAVAAMERVFARVMPESLWSYIHVRAACHPRKA